MRSLTSTWGIAVDNLSKAVRKTCRQLSTMGVDMYVRRVPAGDNPLFSTHVTDSFTRRFTQDKISLLHLLRSYLSPFSTAPITTNEKKGFKN